MINENTKRVNFPNLLSVSTKLVLGRIWAWLISGIKRIGDPWMQAAQVSRPRQGRCFMLLCLCRRIRELCSVLLEIDEENSKICTLNP